VLLTFNPVLDLGQEREEGILGLASANPGTQPYSSPLHRVLDTFFKSTERGGKMVKSLLSIACQSPVEIQKLDRNAILREQVSLLERNPLATVCLKLDLEMERLPIQGDASALTLAFMKPDSGLSQWFECLRFAIPVPTRGDVNPSPHVTGITDYLGSETEMPSPCGRLITKIPTGRLLINT
jgi:hypothetical protein